MDNTEYNITIPTSWDEITLNTFIKLQSLYANENKPSFNEIISVLTNIELNELNEYPYFIIEKLMDKLDYLSQEITDKASNKIEINGETYQINYLEHLKFGEYVDVNTVIDGDKNNFKAILAILCRKEGEIYNDDFIALELNKRMDMFDMQPITKVYPLINFFLTLSMTSEHNMKQYLENLKDLANHTVQHYINSLKSGLGRKRFLNWRMRKLQKLKKSLECI
jgi:hypothetical protein